MIISHTLIRLDVREQTAKLSTYYPRYAGAEAPAVFNE